MGHKNSIPLDPYLRWVQSRAQNLKMPYPAILPVIINLVIEGDVSHTVLYPDTPADFEELQKSWIPLKEERDISET